jgi:hypothetical protein
VVQSCFAFLLRRQVIRRLRRITRMTKHE